MQSVSIANCLWRGAGRCAVCRAILQFVFKPDASCVRSVPYSSWSRRVSSFSLSLFSMPILAVQISSMLSLASSHPPYTAGSLSRREARGLSEEARKRQKGPIPAWGAPCSTSTHPGLVPSALLGQLCSRSITGPRNWAAQTLPQHTR